ncbi:hypothetical protein LCGC14_0447500 [marine sediment metagenome]|uniref:MalT-like TPR region domain-containing protein n=1 Tax=marine sediment metagenome TaxID=412755 RepID=A0A0F9SIQ2_9ZZZZ|nr:hypothetical protein [Candidatus Aminicenantes bacterium]
MAKEDRYSLALYLASKGQLDKASFLLWKIVEKTNSAELMLNSILALVTMLGRKENNEKIINLCDKGIELSYRLNNENAKAFLMATKALSIIIEVEFNLHKKKNLVLAPGWKEFALESIKEEFTVLTRKIEQNRSESQQLITESFKGISSSQISETLADVLMIKGEYHFDEYLNYKIENIKTTKFRLFLKNVSNIDSFLYNQSSQKTTKRILKDSKKCIIDAAQIYKNLGDEINQANAYLNLANQAISINRKKEARKYLKKAITEVQNNKNLEILNRIRNLEERLMKHD